jgi:hypothetical protein
VWNRECVSCVKFSFAAVARLRVQAGPGAEDPFYHRLSIDRRIVKNRLSIDGVEPSSRVAGP